MRLTKVVVEGAKKAFGVRMVKEGSVCKSEIKGLFTWDYDAEDWRLTEQTFNAPPQTMIPVRLLGDPVCPPVTWRTEWNAEEEHAPLFLAAGEYGIVFWKTDGFAFTAGTGTLKVWASAGGQEYGPVSIEFIAVLS
jgi:hypothetical protein